MSLVTQQLLARKLKLSGTTVSRSLANHPAIAKETRARVLEAAEKMGFSLTQKHFVHRKKTAKNITIGVLIGVRNKAPGTATFPFLLKGIHERAATENVLVEVQYQNPDEFHPEVRGNRVFRRIREGGWRGLILIYPFATAAIEVLSRKISAVAALEQWTVGDPPLRSLRRRAVCQRIGFQQGLGFQRPCVRPASAPRCDSGPSGGENPARWRHGLGLCGRSPRVSVDAGSQGPGDSGS